MKWYGILLYFCLFFLFFNCRESEARQAPLTEEKTEKHVTSPETETDIQFIRIMCPESDRDVRNDYFLTLLKMALEKTKIEYGEYRIEFSKNTMPQSRAIELIEKERLDIIWTMTSLDREKQLLPVRIPLLKGLLGYRISLIKKENREIFAHVKTLSHLLPFIAGQGHDWPDTTILKTNGIQVMTTSSYENLFKMLAAGRFDYFPRGVSEAFAEVEQYPEMNLIVDEHLLLKYPAPIYFFVNNKDLLLAERMEKGLMAAVKDGSFNKIFYTHPHLKIVFEKGNLEKRTVFELENPFLPPETPLDQPELWFK